MVEAKPTIESDIAALYEEFQNKLDQFDAKKNPPPIFTNFFTPLKREYFGKLQDLLKQADKTTSQRETYNFAKRIDQELIPKFKKLVKQDYMTRILDRDYNIPKKVDTTEAKGYQLDQELYQLSDHVADWSMELELLIDFICSLEMYGVMKLRKKKEDYIKSFKAEFALENYTSLPVRTVLDYLLKRIVGYLLRRATQLAMIRGINRMQFTAPVLMEIIYSITYLKIIPWAIILRFINVPWVMGTFVVYIALTKLQQYLQKENAKSRLLECDETLNSSKLYMNEVRNRMVSLLVECLDPEATEETKTSCENGLRKELEDLLCPKKVREDLKGKIISSENEDQMTLEMYNVRELEDYVIMEDQTYLEQENEDGFIVVDIDNK